MIIIIIVIMIRPHRSVTYVDAVYCYLYRVAWSVRSVGLSVTLVNAAKTAEPIEFGLRTRVGPGNHVLDGVQMPHGKGQV